MMMWVQVTPSDDLWQIDERLVEGDPTDVKKVVDDVEGEHRLLPSFRFIDPNMGASPCGSRREVTWQDEFDRAGLLCDLASDSDVGRARVNEYLKLDERTLSPRILIHPRCTETITQIKRYVWDDFRRALEKAQKQTPKDKNDDFPTLWKYLLNTDPTFSFYKEGAKIVPSRRNLTKKRKSGMGRPSNRHQRARGGYR
jgi:hypothetical protein